MTLPTSTGVLPTQYNTISMDEAIIRTANWRSSIEGLFTPPPHHGSGTGDHNGSTPIPERIIPKSMFISLRDISQIVDDYAQIGIHLSGIRVYFTLQDENKHKKYHIDGIVVPTVRKNIGITEYNEDLIMEVPVPSTSPGADDGTGTSIYDFTRPCPTYCDGSSADLTGGTNG